MDSRLDATMARDEQLREPTSQAMHGDDRHQQPKCRLWCDAPGPWKDEAFLWVAFGAFCTVGGVAVHLTLRGVPWPVAYRWKIPLVGLWPYLLALGLVVVAAVAVCFCALAVTRRDALTGRSTGVVKLGWDPRGRDRVVAHIRRGDYEFACCCKLMHSDEDAFAAGWHLSGETRNRKRLAWGGLASLFRDDLERML